MPVLVLIARSIAGGALSALLGVAAAFFVVPAMARLVPVPRAIGTTTALVLPMALVGTAGYLATNSPEGCSACWGYVYLPALAAMSISAVLAMPLGVWAAQVVPAVAVRRIFAVVMVIAAGNLTFHTLTASNIGADAANVMAFTEEWLGTAKEPPVGAEVPDWLRQQDTPGAQ